MRGGRYYITFIAYSFSNDELKALAADSIGAVTLTCGQEVYHHGSGNFNSCFILSGIQYIMQYQ